MLEPILDIPLESWLVLREMAPYLLFGFGVAGVLSVLISAETVERNLGGRGLMPVIKATLFGIPLPLCSCGVIPVAASLRRHGATRGATTSFLLSTPQTGVDSIMVTLGLLGPVFAVFRPLVALVTGLVGGALVNIVDRQGDSGEDIERCHQACCTGDAGTNKTLRAANYAFVTLPRDIGRALLVGLLAVGLISAFVPHDFFAGAIGTGIGAMLVMMLLGLPMYVCATASVPIAAALMVKGVTPGAAFVFLMTGPATNAATITTIWKVMGRRTAVIYLGTVAVMALLAGVTLDLILVNAPSGGEIGMGWMLPGYVKTAAAILLLAVLAYAFLKPAHSIEESAQTGNTSSQQVALTIGGMTCTHCQSSVKRALLECDGVAEAQVDLKSGQAIVRGATLQSEALADSVAKLGFSARLREQPGAKERPDDTDSQ